MSSSSSAYNPSPIDTNSISLPLELLELIELLAKDAHDVWAQMRIRAGWRYGDSRNDVEKLTPCLVSYEQLPDSEREYDRVLVRHTIGAIIALGYRIEKNSRSS
jgi:RyR domain-containing protein